MIRSFLFVPGDSERKQVKALASAADAIIFDLEDSVAAARLPAAREIVAGALRSRPAPLVETPLRTPSLWVRVGSLASDRTLEDLVAVMPAQPDGIVLPKIASPHQVIEISHYLAALERRECIRVGRTKLLVIATETPRALLTLDRYVDTFHQRLDRLVGLTWGMEDLGAALATTSKVDGQGKLTFTFQLARSTCLLTAAALDIQAIDGVQADFRDTESLKGEAAAARRDGFTGKLAIHPDQVDIINAAFSPSAEEVEKARRIVAAFAASPDAGVSSLDGAMIDRPHLVQAQRILAAAERTGVK